MKVLVFTSLFPNNVWPNHGVFVKERMLRFARREDSQVRVVAPVPYFPPLKWSRRWKYSQVARNEVIDGLAVRHPRYVMTPKVGMFAYGVLMHASVSRQIRRLHAEFEFDLIDAHYVYPDGMAAILCGRRLSKPVVVSARGSDINQFSEFPLIRRLLRFTLDRADGVIAVCQALKDRMVELGVDADKIAVVPNGVDAAKFAAVPREQTRQALGISARRTILSVGHLIERKGFDLLIDAHRELRKNYPEMDPELVIVGEGPLRASLEQRVERHGLTDRVRFAGSVPHGELHRWYSAADVSCLASSREGWPNVVLESMACGTPVVATNVWGVPEIICSDRVGILVDRNVEALARGLGAALNQVWDRDAIVDFARHRSWEKTADALDTLFRSILSRRR
jgi:glycosyltransferase involved in cell wall biosynthesis